MLRSRVLSKIMTEDDYANIVTLMDNKTKDLDVRTNEQAENEFVDGLFICMADNGWYGKLKTRLSDDFALGDDKYPYTLTAALALLRDFEE